MVSKKCKYALRALFELALRDSSKPVKIHDIAISQAIPQRFLEIILAELKHAGFVESRRGNEGGYLLSKSADNLTIGKVIMFLERNSKKESNMTIEESNISGTFAFCKLWDKVSSAITNIYNNTTFSDLVEEEKNYREKYIPNYNI